MDRMLDTLALIAGMVGAALPASANWVSKAQADLDNECKQVQSVKATDHTAPVAGAFRVVNINAAVEQFQIQRAVLPPSGSLDVFVDVIQSAQQGTLYINCGSEQLNLGSQNSSFVLRLDTPAGARLLSFSSGVTTYDVAGAIRHFAGSIGATAFAEASGVTIQSERFGDNAFISVRVVDDGGLQDVAPGVGLYRTMPANSNQPDPATRIDLDSTLAASGVTDRGQDIRGIVNGWSITGQGTHVWINRPNLKLRIDVAAGPLEPGMTANAQNPGIFRAFTLIRWP